jgi:hypothetical protein
MLLGLEKRNAKTYMRGHRDLLSFVVVESVADAALGRRGGLGSAAPKPGGHLELRAWPEDGKVVGHQRDVAQPAQHHSLQLVRQVGQLLDDGVSRVHLELRLQDCQALLLGEICSLWKEGMSTGIRN